MDAKEVMDPGAPGVTIISLSAKTTSPAICPQNVMPNVQHARSTAQFRDGDIYVGIAKVVHASNYAGRPLLNVRFPAELATFSAVFSVRR